MDEMTLEEAFAAATVDVPAGMVDDIFVIDAPNRKIIVPDSESTFGVETDQDAERKYFRCPRIVGDNIDLYAHKIYVVYVTAKDVKGTFLPDIVNDKYWCDDVTVDGDCITFSWKLSGNVLSKAGIIAFKILAKTTENGMEKTRWNTAPAYGTILMTVPDGDDIAERYPDIVTQLLERMDAVEAIATEEAMQGYVNEYMAENPPSGMTADEKAQLNKNTEDISSLSEEIGKQTGTGLSTEAINKLEEVGNYLAYTTTDGGSKWTELISILRNGSSGGGSGETVPATGISLDKTTLSFTDSATQTLVATVEPSDTTDKVVWTSNAESVATVTNGVVKPLSNGSATITATCGSVSATCSVTVDIAEEEQVTLTSISATYTGGDVTVGTALTDLTGITVTATYSDGSTANVTDYTLSGTIAEGSNTITVSYGGKTTTFTVTGVAMEIVDTTPVVEYSNKGITTSAETYDKDGWGITKFYQTTATNFTYYYTNEAGIEAPQSSSNKTMGFSEETELDGTSKAGYFSPNFGAEKTGTFSATPTGIRATVVTAEVDNYYLYETQTGKIIFAGRNTKYYGMSNISQYTGA